jgi:nucleotide sugar dehydrogenase
MAAEDVEGRIELLRKCEDRSARVVVVGQGYVGLVLAMRASEVGFQVTGLEIDENRMRSLVAGRSPTNDISDVTLRAAFERGYRLCSAAEWTGEFDIAIIVVSTPLRSGEPDVSCIEAASRSIGRMLRPGALVVLESTTYPGTTVDLVQPLLEQTSGLSAGRDFWLGYSPERIDPGNPAFGLVNTPKLIAGIDHTSLAIMEAFYGSLVHQLVPVGTVAEAEFAKLLENTFRYVNIALVNELAMAAAELGVDIWKAIAAAATKPFGFMPFQPGPGTGGHCLPVDPTYLTWRMRRAGRTSQLLQLADEINNRMPAYIVDRVQALLGAEGLAIKDAKVLVLGLAYKAGVSDAREAPSLAIIERLLALGATVSVADPTIVEIPVHLWVQQVSLDEEALRSADLVILVTDHTDFDYDLIVRASRKIFDTRNRLRPYNANHVERL